MSKKDKNRSRKSLIREDSRSRKRARENQRQFDDNWDDDLPEFGTVELDDIMEFAHLWRGTRALGNN